MNPIIIERINAMAILHSAESPVPSCRDTALPPLSGRLEMSLKTRVPPQHWQSPCGQAELGAADDGLGRAQPLVLELSESIGWNFFPPMKIQETPMLSVLTTGLGLSINAKS